MLQFLPHPIIKINMFRKTNEATEVIMEVITTETKIFEGIKEIKMTIREEADMGIITETNKEIMVDEEVMGIINVINMVEIIEDIKDMEVTIKEIKMTIREEAVMETTLEEDTEVILEEVTEDRIQIIATTEVDNLKYCLCVILHSYLRNFVVI